MGKFEEMRKAEYAPDAVRVRETRNDRYQTVATHFPDNTVSGFATSFSGEIPQDEQSWRNKIQEYTGLPIPAHREVVLVNTRYWGVPGALNVYAQFKIIDREFTGLDFDPVALLKDLRGNRKKPSKVFDGDSSLVLNWNDWQIGKAEGGGTKATVERIDSAFDSAILRAKELRKINRSLGKLVIIGGGDIVEGCFIFPNHSFQIDCDRRTQVNTATSLILDGIDRLAPYFSQVDLLVVPGNHGEHRVAGNKVNSFDNDDCLVFENAARATERDSRLSHVKFHVAQNEVAKTLDVNGWILGTTHGQAFGKNPGGNAEIKALNWFKGQKLADRPIGNADVFVTHHFHHDFTRDWGGVQWVQTRAMDGGSQHFTEVSGMYAEPGMNSFVMTPEKRYTDPQVLN